MRVVYLDQNHWIGLARAYFEKSTENREVLDHAIGLVQSGKIRVPVGSANRLELHKVKSLGRRERLAEFFVLLSEGWFLCPWNLVIDAECYNAVVEVYELPKAKVEVDPVGRGMIFAQGAYDLAEKDLGLSYEEARAWEKRTDSPDALIAFMAGTDGGDAAHLRGQLRRQDRQYSEEAERVRNIRLTEVAHELSDYRAMEVFLSIYDHLLVAHLREGISQESLLAGGRERMLQLVSAIPTGYVDWKLGIQRDKQRTRKVAPNDLADLFHLNVAIPYCDLVVTERFWSDLVSRTGLDSRFQTVVASRLDTLLDVN